MPYLYLSDLASELTQLEADEAEHDEQCDYDEARLAALRAFQDQLTTTIAESAEHAESLIPEHEFTEYAEDLADSLGYVGDGDRNPLFQHIDWEGWAESLKADYTKVTLDGDTYLLHEY